MALIAGHLIVSGIGFVLMFAAAMSVGWQWLIAPLAVSLFFPALIADALGLVPDTDPSPLWLLVNTVCWVSVVYPGWLGGCRLIRRVAKARTTQPSRLPNR